MIGEIDYTNEIQTKTKIGMGGICGDFLPNENYNLVRNEIQNWNELTLNDHLERNWSKWYSLNFNIQFENGYFLDPTGGYEIEDYKDFPKEALRVRAAGIHSHIFEDYFVQNKVFLDENWRKISIEEKFEFEEKYRKETSLVKKLTFFVNYLHEPIFSALALNIENNKILFSTSCTNKPYFSIIDFVNKDEKGNPTFEFFNSFDEFLK